MAPLLVLLSLLLSISGAGASVIDDARSWCGKLRPMAIQTHHKTGTWLAREVRTETLTGAESLWVTPGDT